MRVVVTDENIIIDVAAGGLLEEMFRISGWEFCVPDVLYVEELQEHHGNLPALGLRVLAQPAESVDRIAQLRRRYRALSTNDLFALTLARSMGCALLSGDGPLRRAADAEGVEVRGTLWLMAALLEAHLITVEQVATAYEAMRRDGSRLPWVDAEAQIERWRVPHRPK
ncbi:MAG TPA: PIN domain-containing protein [Stenotrophomonas sp.]|nr:PIN domain-containing protein [Stenotrophomonas sp.]